MADVGVPQCWWCMKAQGLLRKEGPPNIGYFVAKLSIIAIPLSESFRRAFVEPAFGELLESPLSESFRRAFRVLSEHVCIVK